MRSRSRGLVTLWVLLAASRVAVGAEAKPRHVIYLHGRIVQEQQNPRPRHPEHGYYELQGILDVFRTRGFVVSGDMRPKPVTESEAADGVVAQVRKLLASGVPAERVTVVGASMGAVIALVASARLQNPDLRFAVLGPCLQTSVPRLRAEEGKAPSGRILAIREATDDAGGPCTSWKEDAERRPGLVAQELVLHTGLKHGFLYRPLPAWVDPVLAWAVR